MSFDQVEFLTLLTDYYEFCNRVFWDHSVVARAPNGGWPSITQSTMANLHKNDAAIDLLRYIPFVDFVEPDRWHDQHVVMLNTRIQDYRSNEIQDRIRNGDLEYYVEPVLGEGEPPLSPSCTRFGSSTGRNGYNLVIDTVDGYVYWGDAQGGHDEPAPELNAVVRERYAGNEAESWREGYNIYRPRDFFALCKQRFRELRWIGLQTNIVEAVRMDCDFDEADDEFMALVRRMRRAGWPGDGEGRDWDREAFQAALSEDSDEEDEDAIRGTTEAVDNTYVH